MPAIVRQAAGPLALAFALGAAQPALAAPETGGAQGVVEITSPVLLENTRSLEFGKIATGAAGGTMTIDPASDTATTSGTLLTFGTDRHRAEFVARAATGTVLVIALDPSVTLTRAGGTETMTATLTRASGPELATATVAVSLPGGLGVVLLPIGERMTAPDASIYVGGSLAVPAGQAQGAYSGTFTLTVAYL